MAPIRNRTTDFPISEHALCQLSYRDIPCDVIGRVKKNTNNPVVCLPLKGPHDSLLPFMTGITCPLPPRQRLFLEMCQHAGIIWGRADDTASLPEALNLKA